jgi:hypothetical protein
MDNAVRQAIALLAGCRLTLGTALLRQAEELDETAITLAVNRTIERALAVRLSVERGIISHAAFSHLATATDAAALLEEWYCRLFGSDANAPTMPTPSDDAIRELVTALANPVATHSFASLPGEFLGLTREQFSQRPLRFDRASGTVTEGKGTYRKTSGTYYTPAPLANYLAERVLGPLLPAAGDATFPPLAILDPSCGGGVFLLAAYRLLLRHHLDRYVGSLEHHQNNLLRSSAGELKLALDARYRILREHLFGVDRDPQALMTTRLTLLLCCYEGTAGETLRCAPDLESNLRCGDTLIGPERDGDQGRRQRAPGIRSAWLPLDWHETFPAIMARDGFDVVIGNPPFLSYSGRQAIAIDPAVRRYLRARYRRAAWPAAHAYFIERAAKTLARRRIAFVVPDQVGHLAGYAPTRALLPGLIEARYWGEEIFDGATTPILTFVAEIGYRGPATIIDRDGNAATAIVPAGLPWRVDPDNDLLATVYRNSETLGKLVGDVGVHSGNCARQLIVPLDGAPAEALPILEGKEVGRYRCARPDRAIRLDYQPKPREYRTIRPESRYSEAQFLIRQTASHPIVGPRRHATYFRNSLLALYPPDDGRAIEYLVGLLNSRLFRYLYQLLVLEGKQRAFPQVKIAALRQLPIRRIDLADHHERAQHDAIAAAVRQLLTLNARLATRTAPAERAACTDEIAAIDHRLDRQIYTLYGLDAADIMAVEEMA